MDVHACTGIEKCFFELRTRCGSQSRYFLRGKRVGLAVEELSASNYELVKRNKSYD